MKFLILISILFWGTIIANYARDITQDVESIDDSLVENSQIEENISILPAIDHQKFDSTYGNNYETKMDDASENEFLIQSSSAESQDDTLSDITTLEQHIKTQHNPYSPESGLGIGIRHLGILTKIGVEKSLYQQMSLALYYGRFLGHYYGRHKNGIIPGLDHYSLEFNLYLNSRKKTFTSGPILKFGIHYNRLKSTVQAQQIEVKGKKIIGRGEHKWGPLIGAAYFWQGPYVNLSVGSEYFVLGKLKSFVPLFVGVGIAF